MPRSRPDPTKVHVPDWTPRTVRMRLAELDVPQKEFAALVGISPNHMSYLLHRSEDFSMLMAFRIDQVLRDLAEACEHAEAEAV